VFASPGTGVMAFDHATAPPRPPVVRVKLSHGSIHRSSICR
jgi:hypothetical protein